MKKSNKSINANAINATVESKPEVKVTSVPATSEKKPVENLVKKPTKKAPAPVVTPEAPTKVEALVVTPAPAVAPATPSLAPVEEAKPEANDEKKAVKEKKKTTKKAPAEKAPVEKAPLVTPAEQTSPKILPGAKVFPAKFNAPVLGELTLATNKYKTLDEINAALDANIQLVFAVYWTKKHIAQYNYSNIHQVNAPKSFENDLDLAQVIVVCENTKKLYAMSVLTEAMYAFFEDELAEDDGLRASSGAEYQIYEASVSATTTPEAPATTETTETAKK